MFIIGTILRIYKIILLIIVKINILDFAIEVYLV